MEVSDEERELLREKLEGDKVLAFDALAGVVGYYVKLRAAFEDDEMTPPRVVGQFADEIMLRTARQLDNDVSPIDVAVETLVGMRAASIACRVYDEIHGGE